MRARYGFLTGSIAAALSLSTLSPARAVSPVVKKQAQAPAAAAAPAQEVYETILEPVYDGGLKSKWQDYGWAPRDTDLGKPARLDLSNQAGWILVRKGLTGKFTSIVFQMAAPTRFGDFLDLRVGSETDDTFPHIPIDAAHRKPMENGWVEVRVSIAELNPHQMPFDRIILRATKAVSSDWVEIDRMSLMTGTSSPGAAMAGVPQGYPTHRLSMQVDCTKPTRGISPMIYGIAYSPRKAGQDQYQWRMTPSARRWGGNPASRYNWRVGNAWNTASDWFFMNVNYTAQPNYTWEMFLDENRTHGALTALTVPMIGWVAKDTKSYSFPVSVYGPQRTRFGQNQDIGDGMRPNGVKIDGSDPRRTSIPASPEFVGEWVQAIQRYNEDNGTRGVAMYILDNEPALWNSTHRDVHPEPVTYDELLKRSIDYGTQVRQADPSALIAGPAEWGWPSYFFSAKDAAEGFNAKPDRRAHGDQPLLAWYLQQMRAQEEKTNQRLLNVLDVHYYPQGDGIYGAHEKNDAATAERRIRATRSLWDPTYKDESWINDRIRLIPRLNALITENYPGVSLSLGEYNFGGERTMSGALAQAEALGRFGQEGLGAAFYWTYPAENSPVYHAFRVFRNYDNLGGRFLDQSINTTSGRSASIFASQDNGGGKIVAVALNFDPREGADTDIDFAGCGDIKGGRTFQYVGTPEGVRKLDDTVPLDGAVGLRTKLPPYSITIFEMTMDPSKRFQE